jgi:hypothetical protein
VCVSCCVRSRGERLDTTTADRPLTPTVQNLPGQSFLHIPCSATATTPFGGSGLRWPSPGRVAMAALPALRSRDRTAPCPSMYMGIFVLGIFLLPAPVPLQPYGVGSTKLETGLAPAALMALTR